MYFLNNLYTLCFLKFLLRVFPVGIFKISIGPGLQLELGTGSIFLDPTKHRGSFIRKLYPETSSKLLYPLYDGKVRFVHQHQISKTCRVLLSQNSKVDGTFYISICSIKLQTSQYVQKKQQHLGTTVRSTHLLGVFFFFTK